MADGERDLRFCAKAGAAVALGLALLAGGAGCSATGAVRRMAPYPAQGQTEAQRQQDMAECESWASAETADVTAESDIGKSALGGALLGGALGAATGAATLAAAGGHGPGAGVGAAVGATIGAISGALSSGTGTAVAEQQTLAAGWRNCMVARGYVVEGGPTSPIVTNDLGTFGGVVGGISSIW